MLMGSAIAVLLCEMLLYGDNMDQSRPANKAYNVQRQETSQSITSIKTTDDWVDKQDQKLVALTNNLRQVTDNYVSATNKIAAVSDNNTRQALNKLADCVKNLQDCSQNIKGIDKSQRNLIEWIMGIVQTNSARVTPP
jgi:ABC-type transporter Mla subunit MlaD